MATPPDCRFHFEALRRAIDIFMLMMPLTPIFRRHYDNTRASVTRHIDAVCYRRRWMQKMLLSPRHTLHACPLLMFIYYFYFSPLRLMLRFRHAFFAFISSPTIISPPFFFLRRRDAAAFFCRFFSLISRFSLIFRRRFSPADATIDAFFLPPAMSLRCRAVLMLLCFMFD